MIQDPVVILEIVSFNIWKPMSFTILIGEKRKKNHQKCRKGYLINSKVIHENVFFYSVSQYSYKIELLILKISIPCPSKKQN